MKAKIFFLVLFFSLFLTNISNAQFGALRKAISKQINQEIDTAVDKSVQKKFDQIEAEKQEENESVSVDDDNGRPGIGLGLFGGKVDLNYDDNYDFKSRIYMVTETYDKKDVFKMDFYMYYSSGNPNVGVETKTISIEEGEAAPMASKMIMDANNKCFIILTDINGTKMGIISDIPDEDDLTDTDDGRADKSVPPDFNKTGNTRMIAGFKCDEYAYTDSDDKTSGKVWFTKDADLKIDKRGWKNSGMAAYYGNDDFNEGIILANEAYDDKGKLVMKSETKEINTNYPYSISVKGYTLRQMNIGQGKR